MWLAWVGYTIALGKGDPADTPRSLRWQLITLGVMLAIAAGCWFIFGLSKKLDFDEPRYLFLTLLVIPIFSLGAWSLSQLEPPRRWTSVYLRMLLLLVLIAMLAGFRTVQRRDDLSVVAIVDVSESVESFALAPEGAVGPDGKPMTVNQWVQAYILEAADSQRTGDTFSYHEFDGRPTVLSRPQEGPPAFPDVVPDPYEGTNVERAIKAGIAARPSPDAAHRLILAWDGNDTTGSVIEAARAAAAEGITIDVLPILYHVENEVMVEGVYVPTEAREGQTLPLRVVLRATAPVPGQVQLKQDDAVLDLNGPDVAGTGRPIDASDWRRVDADAPTTDDQGRLLGDYVLNTVIHRPVTEAGITRYKAIFVPNDQSGTVNAVRENDAAESFTLVAGPGKILIVDGVGGDPGLILPRALGSHGIELDIVTPISMPARAEALQRYDAVIFHNVPADNISPATQEVLSQYVHNFGGGFMMVGGPNAFGAGGWTNSVIDEFILPVSCEIQSQRQLPSGALVLVVDRSGSMFGGNGHIANEAAILALSTLYPQDMVGVVAFDTRAHWVQKLQLNSDPAGTAQRIRSLSPGGGTDVRAGLEAAYSALENVPMGEAAIKHVILVTDGHTGGGNFGIELMGRYRQAGITLTTIGTGHGNNSQLLSNLANMGGGTYYDVTDPNNLPQVFIKEARAIRKNLIFEQTFSPLVRAVGSPIMSGINAVPDLHGFVLTGPKHDPRIFMPITGPEGEPIFAHHQVGLGRAAAYTADATNRWGQDWLTWGGYADFWARSIRQISRPPLSVEADLAATIRGDELVLRLDAAGDLDFNNPAGNAGASAFGNNLKVRGVVTGPSGQVINVELEQVGPGIYETRLPVHESGSYIADLNLARPDGEARRVISGASKLEGGELRNFQSNMAAITQVAELTGGRVLDPAHPDAAGLYARNIPFESVSSRPLLWKLAPFLLFFLILDVACRRIAWDANEIGEWARGRANAVFGIMATRKVEGGATMAALKAKREQTHDNLTHADAERSAASGLAALRQSRATAQQGGQTAATKTPAKKAPKPAASRTRKFVATDEQLATAKDDFTTAVGGAKEGVEAQPIVSARTRKSEKDQGPTTSRLLDAKRRAQERMNDKDE